MEFIETIRVEGGAPLLLPLHQDRMARTVREVYGSSATVPDLAEAIYRGATIPDVGLYKCRILYDSEIRAVELHPYTPRRVESLQIVEGGPELDYHLKLTDRTPLSRLAAMKGACDEVIILRDGLITDTSYTNLLFRGLDAIYTPRKPLLKGVMRRRLLERGEICEADLRPADVLPGNPLGITECILINAMMPLGSIPPVRVTEIKE